MNFNLRGSFRFLTKLPLVFQSTSPLKSLMGCFISGNAHVGDRDETKGNFSEIEFTVNTSDSLR